MIDIVAITKSTSPDVTDSIRLSVVIGTSFIFLSLPKISFAIYLAISISKPSSSPVALLIKPNGFESSLTPTIKTSRSIILSNAVFSSFLPQEVNNINDNIRRHKNFFIFHPIFIRT